MSVWPFALLFVLSTLSHTTAWLPSAFAGGRCDYTTLQYDLFQPQYSDAYVIYVDHKYSSKRPARAATLAHKLMKRGVQVDLVDEINGKIMIRANPGDLAILADLNELDGLAELTGRYQLSLTLAPEQRTEAAYTDWTKRLKKWGVRYVRDDATYGYSAFRDHGEITFLARPEIFEQIRNQSHSLPEYQTLRHFPPTRRPLTQLFSAQTPEASLLRKPLSKELGLVYGSYRVFFDVSTPDRSTFDALVSKLSELEGFEIYIHVPSRATYQVTVSASQARMNLLKRAITTRTSEQYSK